MGGARKSVSDTIFFYRVTDGVRRVGVIALGGRE